MPGAKSYGSMGDKSKAAEDGGIYTISNANGDYSDDAPSDEATSLLSAGAQDSDPGHQPLARKDTWVGDKEYAHLPWHQQPSVCCL